MLQQRIPLLPLAHENRIPILRDRRRRGRRLRIRIVARDGGGRRGVEFGGLDEGEGVGEGGGRRGDGGSGRVVGLRSRGGGGLEDFLIGRDLD